MPSRFAILFPLLASAQLAAIPADSDAYQRGEALYGSFCAACHQLNGQGIPGAIPPLALSDYLMADRDRSIEILIQGLAGKIEVNGASYNGAMPPPGLDDQQTADTLTYIRSAWGNRGDAVRPNEIAARRIALAKQNQDSPYQSLPVPPAGFVLREAVRLEENAVRLAALPGSPYVFALSPSGNVYRLNTDNGSYASVLSASSYVQKPEGTIRTSFLGMLIDSRRRLYLVATRLADTTPHQSSQITIYRSPPLGENALPEHLVPWFETAYPYGNGGYSHGVSGMAQGPDGAIYVNSGSRTDSNEPFDNPKWQSGGETELTACIWKLDPEAPAPQLEIFARGTRNAWSLCLSPDGDLLMVDNGPKADAPEEINHIQQGKHYGFPYVFGDQLATDLYPHGNPIPDGLELTAPIKNIGPHGGGSPDKPLLSFDAHSSPAGFIHCGDAFPEPLRGKYLVGRYGSMEVNFNTGYDLLAVELRKNADGSYESAAMTTFLAPLSRPIDLAHSGNRLYILEHSRQNGIDSKKPGPGRILELSW